MAEYIPITDQEIEPEAPLTSILQHKLRDNPEAVITGSSNAPRIQTDAYENLSVTFNKFNSSSGQVSIPSNSNAIRPGGAYEIGHEVSRTVGNTVTAQVFVSSGTDVALPRGAYISASSAGFTYYNNYLIPSFLFNNIWFFIAVDRISNIIVYSWYASVHPSLGQSSFFEHPFPGIDLNLFDIFCINITKTDAEIISNSQYPVGANEYFDVAINRFSDINPFREKRGLVETFLEKYDIDFDTELTWIEDQFPIGNPDFNIGMDFIYTSIQKPAMVSRLDYNPK